MAFTPLRAAAMNHAKKELHMVLELFQTLRLSFRLAVADADERQHRRNVQHGQRARILCSDLTVGDQRSEDTGVIAQNALHISPGIERRQLR